MSHLDPEQLALLALGEPVASDDERAHLASCRVCAAEVAEMTHAAMVARTTMDEAELAPPPARVWDEIVGELGLSAAVATNPFDARLGAVADAGTAAVAEPSMTPEPVPQPLADAVPTKRVRTRRRSTRALWTLAASVALIVAVGAGVWIGIANLAPASIATASLDAFPDHPEAVGSAEVDEARDGARTLTVTLEGADGSDDYREVWLIRGDGSALISLGVLEGTSGTFPVPPGVDLAEFDLVDISYEPVDGDPAHSGNSIVRGQLSFA